MQIALAQVGAIDVSPSGSVKSETQKHAAKDTSYSCYMFHVNRLCPIFSLQKLNGLVEAALG